MTRKTPSEPEKPSLEAMKVDPCKVAGEWRGSDTVPERISLEIQSLCDRLIYAERQLERIAEKSSRPGDWIMMRRALSEIEIIATEMVDPS